MVGILVNRAFMLLIKIGNILPLLSIDSKLGVWVAYTKRQLRIATQMSVIKVKVTVAKNRNSVSA
jgi:hypothetical protein